MRKFDYNSNLLWAIVLTITMIFSPAIVGQAVENLAGKDITITAYEGYVVDDPVKGIVDEIIVEVEPEAVTVFLTERLEEDYSDLEAIEGIDEMEAELRSRKLYIDKQEAEDGTVSFKDIDGLEGKKKELSIIAMKEGLENYVLREASYIMPWTPITIVPIEEVKSGAMEFKLGEIDEKYLDSEASFDPMTLIDQAYYNMEGQKVDIKKDLKVKSKVDLEKPGKYELEYTGENFIKDSVVGKDKLAGRGKLFINLIIREKDEEMKFPVIGRYIDVYGNPIKDENGQAYTTTKDFDLGAGVNYKALLDQDIVEAIKADYLYSHSSPMALIVTRDRENIIDHIFIPSKIVGTMLKFDANNGEFKNGNEIEYRWMDLLKEEADEDGKIYKEFKDLEIGEEPTRDNYRFLGWTLEKDGDLVASRDKILLATKEGDTIRPEKDLIFYAKWRKDSSGGGGGGGGGGSDRVDYRIIYEDRNGEELDREEGRGEVGDIVRGEEKTFRNYRLYRVIPSNEKIELVRDEDKNIITYIYQYDRDSGSSGGGSTGGGSSSSLPKLNRKDHMQYIQGYPDKTVRPEGYLTREEAAAVFYRLLESNYRKKVYADSYSFTDYRPGRWSNKHVGTLVKARVLLGYPDGSFKPGNYITRGELVAIAYKFEGMVDNNVDRFTDTKNHWARKYINGAYERGLIKGYPDGSFKPNERISRAEFVVIVNNLLDRQVEADGVLPGLKEFKDLKAGKWYYYPMLEALNGHDYDRYPNGREKWHKLVDFDVEM